MDSVFTIGIEVTHGRLGGSSMFSVGGVDK